MKADWAESKELHEIGAHSATSQPNAKGCQAIGRERLFYKMRKHHTPPKSDRFSGWAKLLFASRVDSCIRCSLPDSLSSLRALDSKFHEKASGNRLRLFVGI